MFVLTKRGECFVLTLASPSSTLALLILLSFFCFLILQLRRQQRPFYFLSLLSFVSLYFNGPHRCFCIVVVIVLAAAADVDLLFGGEDVRFD